jgi:UDP-glucose 4-epimerase
MTRRLRLLVTGSSGRLGRALCGRLAADHSVSGLDRVPSPDTTFVGDLLDDRVRRAAVTGVDAVLHLAALHAPHVGQSADDEFHRVNVQATLALAEAAAAEGAKRFVFASTTALYGAGPAGAAAAADWIDEHTVPRPRTIYHRTKLEAEQVLADAAPRLGLTVTVLRVSRCFPEPAPIMAAYRLHRGVDARDVADAHAAALAWQAPGQLRRLIVSATTPFRRDDADELACDAPAVLRRRAPALVSAFLRLGWALPASIDRVYDAAAARSALGWHPRFGFESVLAQAQAGDPAVLAAGLAVRAGVRAPEPCG